MVLRVMYLSMFRKEKMNSELHYQLLVNYIYTVKVSQF